MHEDVLNYKAVDSVQYHTLQYTLHYTEPWTNAEHYDAIHENKMQAIQSNAPQNTICNTICNAIQHYRIQHNMTQINTTLNNTTECVTKQYNM